MSRAFILALLCTVLNLRSTVAAQAPATAASTPTQRQQARSVELKAEAPRAAVARAQPHVQTAAEGARPSGNLRRAANMIAAGAGLTLGAIVGMTAFNRSRFRCGESPGYTYWPAGIVAASGLMITFAGWGELSTLAKTGRKLSRTQRLRLPFLVLGTTLLGIAPLALQPLCAIGYTS